MRPKRRLLLPAAVCLLFTGCTWARPLETRPPVARLLLGQVGWYHVKPTIQLDAKGLPVLPALTPEVLAENLPVKRLLLRTYVSQFQPLKLEAGCGDVDANGQVVLMLVPGIGGDGEEWVPAIPTLARMAPRAMYMYRWFFPKDRGELIAGLVDGVERVAACHPGARLVLLTHSAGGVLSSFAASRFKLPAGASLELLTVASPLAGAGRNEKFDVEDDETRFLMHLGGVIRGYPAAAPGVHVTHLRTSWPADQAMKPGDNGYRPNDPAVKVEGARVIDLPATLNHTDCLQHVALALLEHRL